MGRLRDAALQDSFALDELRRLTDNIGPRISGSRQAEHAVDYVAAEMRALGTDVDPLNKKGVPGFCPNQDSRSTSTITTPQPTPSTKLTRGNSTKTPRS